METAEGANPQNYLLRVNLSGKRTGQLGTSGKLVRRLVFGNEHRRGKLDHPVKLSGQGQGPT